MEKWQVGLIGILIITGTGLFGIWFSFNYELFLPQETPVDNTLSFPNSTGLPVSDKKLITNRFLPIEMLFDHTFCKDLTTNSTIEVYSTSLTDIDDIIKWYELENEQLGWKERPSYYLFVSEG